MVVEGGQEKARVRQPVEYTGSAVAPSTGSVAPKCLGAKPRIEWGNQIHHRSSTGLILQSLETVRKNVRGLKFCKTGTLHHSYGILVDT